MSVTPPGGRPAVDLYTDGACLGNPGPGGYAAILVRGSARKEISGGFRNTTNNRMEIFAAIAGLSALKEPCRVNIHTDSQYLANAIRQGWLKRWQSNGWKTAAKAPVKNIDLWQRMLALLSRHSVEFHWLRGHVGHPDNERADQLAVAAARGTSLPADPGFESETLSVPV